MKPFCVLFILTIAFGGCSHSGRKKPDVDELRRQIEGSWVKINEMEGPDDVPTFTYERNQGMTVSVDSIEFHLGFHKQGWDTEKKEEKWYNLGSRIAYRLEGSGISIYNTITKKWEPQWKSVHRQGDTLVLAFDDTTFVRYKKLTYNMGSLPDFDQIVYSSSPCYGSCPIENVVVDKRGEIFYQGEGYVEHPGFHIARIGAGACRFVFDKFRQAAPLSLRDHYESNSTDMPTVTTSYVCNGKIVKTVHDYGAEATSGLVWAYFSMKEMLRGARLDSLPADRVSRVKLRYFAFKKGGLELRLEKSQSFYLLSQLEKATQTSAVFRPAYEMEFLGARVDSDKTRQRNTGIDRVVTDGRFYRFESHGSAAVTYDLGYNFVDRNFKPSDFRKSKDLYD